MRRLDALAVISLTKGAEEEKTPKKEQPGSTLCKLKGVNHRTSQLVPVEGDATSRTDTRLGGEGLVECAIGASKRVGTHMLL